MEKVHIIAEAGTNHNAQREKAELLIQAAAAAGADSVKFQIIYPEGLYVTHVYKDGQLQENEVVKARRAGMLGDDDYRHLARLARQEYRLPFSASVFDARGLQLLDELDPPYIKIASCDLNNGPLLKQAARCGRKLIVSTGMSTRQEVQSAVEDITSTGHHDLVLMHCVSVYPCPTEQMNLAFIEELKTFGFPVGLSDHTENSLAAAAAVAMGVTWIEKHFTLDRTSPGFDHAYAMEPEGLRQYIADIRRVEQACRPAAEKVGQSEATVRSRARRSLYAARDIAPGETITDADVLVVRPEGPMQPNQLGHLVGRRASRAIRRCEPFTLTTVE